MATLECLACGHPNAAGEASCAACSASLRLQLCRVCEAINAHDAACCHSCRRPFGREDGALPVRRTLMATWVISGEPARWRRRSTWLAMIVAAAGLAIYLYDAGVPPAPIEAAHAAQPAAVDRE